MRERWIGVLAAALVAACFEESPPVDPTAGMDGTTSSTTAPEPTGTTTGPSPDTDPRPTTSSTTAADGTATADESTGDSIPIECGDGMPVPGELCFEETTVLTANEATYSARIGDVSGTPAADVVYLITDQVVVRVGSGDGNFGPAVFDATLTAQRLELDDFDQDGELDLVVPDQEGYLRVLLGSGAGSFLPGAGITTSSVPRALAVGTIDGDEHLDAVVATESAMLYTGIGDGMGNLESLSTSLAEAPFDLALADFDADGVADLVLGGPSGVTLHRGTGLGDFLAAEPTSGQMGEPRSVAAADFDADGRADVAYASAAADAVSVLFGDGQGGFAPELAAATGSQPSVVHAADLDGDGRPELAVAHQGESTLRVYTVEPGRGPTEALQIPLAAIATAIDSGDVDDDGVPDLAATSTDAGIVTLVLSTP